MPYLIDQELQDTFYPRARNMEEDERTLYLQRANSYAWGIVGGMVTYSAALPADPLKAAVALAFEILSKGETGADVNAANGMITESAPAGFFARTGRQEDPLQAVRVMLKPYADAFISQNSSQSDRGIRFLP